MNTPEAARFRSTMLEDRPTCSPCRCAAAIAALFLVSATASADEGGVSFWLPGQMSSFAAVPGAPGWSLPLDYHHASEDASASKNFTLGGTLVAASTRTSISSFSPRHPGGEAFALRQPIAATDQG